MTTVNDADMRVISQKTKEVLALYEIYLPWLKQRRFENISGLQAHDEFFKAFAARAAVFAYHVHRCRQLEETD